ncbi:IQ domain-containing protein IQM4-like [Teratosphaeria destructans]|uniref:IQ domain-containing protein IQM4-like n=1 Tax=Teratosphaeria destructans TaxID=418781 RepID=A0A9W7VYE9_9PEZI|nr:IQ domain-containing protein IQM4-like [Teratosphaeria destructans]
MEPQYDDLPAASPHDHYALPSAQRLKEIEAKQDEQARKIKERRATEAETDETADSKAQSHAAEVIQRNYRGYRSRRAMKGHGLDPSTRWIEAVKEARYMSVTSPKPRSERHEMHHTRDRWRRLGAIAQRAGNDDTSESEGDETNDPDQAREKQKRRLKKAERDKYARNMGLEYFLEMVDQKHRYGSNLRRYHQEWKQSDTHENFFYWLDHGEGKDLDLEDRPRKRLDTEQVRYLSREERQRYLVKIDKEGRFCWAKDGRPINTSLDFKDSINGIVPVHDETPSWREVQTGEKTDPASSDDSDSVSGTSTGSQVDAAKYSNQELHDAKGLNKLHHLSVDTLMNHLLRKTTKKNTWIFVADTSFRLYIGIKQSGAFQHSSFLHGARVSAAGLIKIKRGQLRKLSPLSGHYAPPVKNFKMFLESLKEAGADLRRCNVSRSYAVLYGLEAYIGGKKRVKKGQQGVVEFLRPEEKRRREMEGLDNSESARREREVLKAQAEKERRESGFSVRLKKVVPGA